MAAIRLAAAVPLLALAPKASLSANNDTLAQSLVSSSTAQLAFAYGYTQAATAVTVQRDESSEDLAADPINPKGPVTVKVTYLLHCSVPIIRTVMCQPLSYLQHLYAKGQSLYRLGDPGALRTMVSNGARYVVLTGQATLTNQGADYLKAENGP